jgi:hypothetical protein
MAVLKSRKGCVPAITDVSAGLISVSILKVLLPRLAYPRLACPKCACPAAVFPIAKVALKKSGVQGNTRQSFPGNLSPRVPYGS